MKANLLVGSLVTLRGFEDKDRDILIESKRDPEFLKLVGEDMSDEPALTDIEFEDIKHSQLHWAIDRDGVCIGGALLHSLNEQDKRAEYAIAIFNRDNWGKGYGEEATRLVLDYAFSKLLLHRVGLRVLSYNHRAIRCYEKCGFLKEGVQRQSAFVNNAWYDDIMMGVLASEFSV